MATSSSRPRSSSPFQHQRPSSSYSSSSSTSSLVNDRSISRSSASSVTSFHGPGNGVSSRSMAPSHSRSESMYSAGFEGRGTVGFPSSDELIGEAMDTPKAGESISVTIRFRPLSEREFLKGDEISWYPDGDKIVRNEYNPATAYAFDRVFGPSTTTQEVYEVAARPVVKAAMEGVNGTVFAYGVTSSGKTHTMHGDHDTPGIVPLAIRDVFGIIQDTPGREFLLRVSYIEIYNEVINDLLDPSGQNLRVREDAQGTYVEGLKEEVVLSPGHALSFIAAGEEHRHVGSNNFNLFSSRSHTIFTLMIESSAHGDEYDGVIYSQLNLIDLAGSESSKTETTGIRRKEGSYINKSLLTLGTVIGKLSEGKASHVPFRDSKLTRLLQSSLSGHGHVSLICTVTPASSNMEETHNTLKFASRAKCIEIYASCNKIIDEKSLIKKYQREISSLRLELDQLKKGVVAGISHEEILSLRQQLEEGQVKMRSRLEEEEEAKAALMSRIQRLTKLILVSTKYGSTGCSYDNPNRRQSDFVAEDDKLDASLEDSLLVEGENQKDCSSFSLAVQPDPCCELTTPASEWSDKLSSAGSTITDSAQAGELIGGSSCGSKLSIGGMSMSYEIDLLVEQVKMLSGEIAFSTSALKRLVEQSVNDPNSSRTQIQNMEREIQEKRRQMRMIEQRITESGEASMSTASVVDMQQTVMRLTAQCNEKGFELEIKSADNRILQEQLQNKCAEIKALQENIHLLQQQLTSPSGGKSPSSSGVSEEYIDELRRKIQYLEIENEKLKLEQVQILEENSGLHVHNQKVSEEASYAKELASAAAVELKNLAAEITKLSLQNAKLEEELLSAKELAHSRGASAQSGYGCTRNCSDGISIGRKGLLSSQSNGIPGIVYDDLDLWNLNAEDFKMELQARKQRETALEATLAQKEIVEDEYRKMIEEAKRREAALENDLANMWVLVAQLKREGGAISVSNTNETHSDATDHVDDLTLYESKVTVLKEEQVMDVNIPANAISKEEPLLVLLKARMQQMKEKGT